ncbi:Tetratricopeptide repeat-containing domain [Phytophthora cactorum]|nr:Tetratricopeptide repeat-containing domain [Phytophthora cactorum]
MFHQFALHCHPKIHEILAKCRFGTVGSFQDLSLLSLLITMYQTQDGAGSSYTSTIYGFIRDQKYEEAVRILQIELENHPHSRAALSLLGYCYYHMQLFHQAVGMYEQLCANYPEVDEYQLYLAQSLYKSGQYDAASRRASQLESEQFAQRVHLLRAASYYEQNDIKATRSVLEECLPDDPTTIVFDGAIEYKEGRYEAARAKFADALNILGYQPDLSYNIALCFFKMKQYGSKSEQNADVKSVRNSTVLRETALVEAFNLKAAIEYEMKNYKGARDALLDMPPRQEEELDPVSLHNFGLMNMDVDPNGGFKKLNFLLQNPPFPVETFSNLLILYTKHGFHDLMADVLAENAHLTFQLLSKDFYDFMDATVTLQTSPEDAYRKYDELATKHVEGYAYDDALEDFMPVLMAQANIYWERGNYTQVEKIFRQTAEFCSEHEAWKLNVAHVFFLQGNKYEQAIQYYEPFVKKHQDNLLDREEEEESSRDPDKRLFHLCIVNLVIGTLYCSKNNYDFGICRVMKSMEPYHRKLGPDTWYYAKRCFLGLALTLAKHMTTIRDSTMDDILEFLDCADQHGKDIFTTTEADQKSAGMTGNDAIQHTISYEVRDLRPSLSALIFSTS